MAAAIARFQRDQAKLVREFVAALCRLVGVDPPIQEPKRRDRLREARLVIAERIAARNAGTL